MPISETWLLPDGVADVLPEQAFVIETLRRQLVDFLAQRGYQLVYTPFIEYIESLSLLSQPNQDLDLVTVKIIDQLSGRLVGIRADSTPQVARIDAHVRPVKGVARYCYAGTVLHAKPIGLAASRTPLQLGAELYGHSGLDADLEMIDTMLGLLQHIGMIKGLHLDLSHVGLFRSLVKLAGLDHDQEQQLSRLYQRKAWPELKTLVSSSPYGQDIYALGRYATHLDELTQHLSPTVLQQPEFKQALDDLKRAYLHVKQSWPNISVGLDVVELRGYHYHTGLMFAAYAPQKALPIAQGGRYDGIGQHFGRARPATGFSCDVYDLVNCSLNALETVVAPAGKEADLIEAVRQTRAMGWRVVQLLGHDELSSIPYATHQLVKTDMGWQVQKI